MLVVLEAPYYTIFTVSSIFVEVSFMGAIYTKLMDSCHIAKIPTFILEDKINTLLWHEQAPKYLCWVFDITNYLAYQGA